MIVFFLSVSVPTHLIGVVREELIAHLPEGQQTVDDLQQTLRSPQLRQSMSALSHAVATDPTHFQAIASNLHLDASSSNVTNQLVSVLRLVIS